MVRLDTFRVWLIWREVRKAGPCLGCDVHQDAGLACQTLFERVDLLLAQRRCFESVDVLVTTRRVPFDDVDGIPIVRALADFAGAEDLLQAI